MARALALLCTAALLAAAHGRLLKWKHNNNFDEKTNWMDGAVPDKDSNVDLRPLGAFGDVGAQAYVGPTPKSTNGNVNLNKLTLANDGSLKLGVGASITFTPPKLRSKPEGVDKKFKLKPLAEVDFFCASNWMELNPLNMQPKTTTLSPWRPPCATDSIFFEGRSAAMVVISDGAKASSVNLGSSTFNFANSDDLPEASSKQLYFPVRPIDLSGTCGLTCDLFCVNNLNVCPMSPSSKTKKQQLEEEQAFHEAVRDRLDTISAGPREEVFPTQDATARIDNLLVSVDIPDNTAQNVLSAAAANALNSIKNHFLNNPSLTFGTFPQSCCGALPGGFVTPGCNFYIKEENKLQCRFSVTMPKRAESKDDDSNPFGFIDSDYLSEEASAVMSAELLQQVHLVKYMAIQTNLDLGYTDVCLKGASPFLSSQTSKVRTAVQNFNTQVQSAAYRKITLAGDPRIVDGKLQVAYVDRAVIEGDTTTPLGDLLIALRSEFVDTSIDVTVCPLSVYKFTVNAPNLRNSIMNQLLTSTDLDAYLSPIRSNLNNNFGSTLQSTFITLGLPLDLNAGNRRRRADGDVNVFVATPSDNQLSAADMDGFTAGGDTASGSTMTVSTLADMAAAADRLEQFRLSLLAAQLSAEQPTACGTPGNVQKSTFVYDGNNRLDFAPDGTNNLNFLTIELAKATIAKATQVGMDQFYNEVARSMASIMGYAVQAPCFNFTGELVWKAESEGRDTIYDRAYFTIPMLTISSDQDLTVVSAQVKDALELALELSTMSSNTQAAEDRINELQKALSALNPTTQSPGESSSGGSSMVPIIGAAAAAVIIVIIIAVVIIMKKRGSSPKVRRTGSKGSVDRTVVAFENPMYDDPTDNAGGVMYDAAATDEGGEGLYDQPAFNEDGGAESEPYKIESEDELEPDYGEKEGAVTEEGGYLDVAPEDE